MKFECPNCNKFGNVDDSKVPEDGLYANCPNCNTRFLIKKPNPDFTFEPTQAEVMQEPTSQKTVEQPKQRTSASTDLNQLYRAAIGKNTDYYLPIFNRFDKEINTSASWNWAAFFGSWIWLCYRKMNKLGTMVFIAIFILILASNIESFALVAALLQLVLQIGIGVYSNKLYHKHINERISDLKNNQSIILKSGGVSNAFLYIAYGFIGIAFLGIIAAIVIPQIGKSPKAHNMTIPSQTVSKHSSQTTITSKDKSVDDCNNTAFSDLRNTLTGIFAYESDNKRFPNTLDYSDKSIVTISNNVIIDNYSITPYTENGQQYFKVEFFTHHTNGDKIYKANCAQTGDPCAIYEKPIADNGNNWVKIQ